MVGLFSDNPAVAAEPPTVTVPAGAMTARFPVRTQPPPAQTLVDIGAGYQGKNTFAEIQVHVHWGGPLVFMSPVVRGRVTPHGGRGHG